MKYKVPTVAVSILSGEGPTRTLWITRPPRIFRAWTRLLDWGDEKEGRPITLVAGAFSSGWILLFLHLPGRTIWEETIRRSIPESFPDKVRILRRILPGMVDRAIERGIRSQGFRSWVKGTRRSRS